MSKTVSSSKKERKRMKTYGDTEETRTRVGEALRSCMRDRMTQVELAEELDMLQPTVSKYVTGTAMAPLEFLAAAEAACDRPRGWVLIHSGYVDPPLTTESALEADPNLTDEERRVLLAAYQGFLAGKGPRTRKRGPRRS